MRRLQLMIMSFMLFVSSVSGRLLLDLDGSSFIEKGTLNIINASMIISSIIFLVLLWRISAEKIADILVHRSVSKFCKTENKK